MTTNEVVADVPTEDSAIGAGGLASIPLRGFRHSNGYLFGTMLASAALSLLAAFVLSIDAVVLAATPDAVLACDINSVLSCGTVALSDQAQLFGFPNSFLGLACEPVVITIAVASLAGVRFPRWFMLSAQVIYLLGLTFAYWLFYQSSFVIHALCPWCLVITFGTTAVFMTLLHVNLRDNNFYLSARWHERARAALRMNLDTLVTVVLLTVITATIFLKYGARVLGM
ncbi:vitamin K epoxide reductase family protein [Rarobacter incanus]|uniref:vitamin K epoxide reductase family protein n=1 Tax=Rarobacter incanus TaxID=153494 RepID=UPI001FE3945F|nr:vitamin K epoxide reductase family protein [Rarobacter incanus]